ncbi:lycopene cyclase domain-containing protein [Flavobacterium psychrotrophum]|uniref:lycopene cyclase domain-containing protein n=1 Tax=Flavobacterium psychrotrophum TaxID=2294119 RepID=UPI000E30B8F2|nr:lycopene cyclase domain-containing protein [Flavobacterium psychrotrophum]
MDTITYLLITLLLLLPWLAIYIYKERLRKKMLKTSFMGGLAGFIAEYWYFKDYWHPPTIMGKSVISFEDFIFGFTITGISVTIYETAFVSAFGKCKKNRKKLFGIMFLCGVAAMIIFNQLLGANSIIVSCTVFMILATVMITLRPDLFRMAILSGLLMIAVVLPVYTLLFDLLNTDYWDDYWLLAHTPLGITVLGNIPLSELCWYFSWGSFAGIAHHFASGNVQIKHAAIARQVTLP